MEEKRRNRPVLEPEEIAVREELKTVGMAQGSGSEFASEAMNIERGLDLFDLRGPAAEDPVHAAFDPEKAALPVKGPRDRDFRFVRRIGFDALFLDADVDLPASLGSAAVA